MSFIRKFSQSAIEALKQDTLFTDHLRADIVEGSSLKGRQKKPHFVFPAVREERIDFYWGGGKLFSYEQSSGFKTHHKYASVLVDKAGKYIPDTAAYISETSLQDGKIRLIGNFCEGYERIKENCERYSGLEDLGVSSLYERFSCARKVVSSEVSPVVVLDIEASFAEGKNQIDIVSLDMESKKIRFVEAKDYSNNASLRTSYGQPEAAIQMKRYAEQIKKTSDEILEAYQNHVRVINTLFSINIPEPTSVDPSPILLIFGFDSEQRSYLKPKIEKPLQDDHGLRVYSIGKIKDAELSVVFRGGKANWRA